MIPRACVERDSVCLAARRIGSAFTDRRRIARPVAPRKVLDTPAKDGIIAPVDGRASSEEELRVLRDRVRYLESLLEGSEAPESANRAAGLSDLGDALVEREVLLAEAESIAHLGSWFWDTATNEVRWSDELFRVLGFEPGGIEPSVELFLRSIHPADRGIFMTTNRGFADGTSSLPNGMLPKMQLRLLRVDGEQRLVELSGRVVLNEGGSPRRVVGTVHDLTHTHETVSALEEASEILRMANQIHGLATWRWNLVTGEMKWSSEMPVLMGVDPRTTPSLSAILEAIHPDDRELARFSNKKKSVSQSGEPLEFRFLRPDGSVCHVVSSYGSFRDAGPGSGTLVVGIMVNVSERRSLEDELRQAKKMEALGRMAGGVAHDFNNYLTVMMGNADLLRASLPATQSSLQGMVDEILKASERCQSMTQRLLAFGRRSKSSPRVLDIAALVRERKSTFQCLAGPTIDLVLNSSAEPCRVRIDETHFEQLLMNLVANARDAMPEGGQLRVTVAAKLQGGDRWVIVDVEDSGVGMDKETQERVFEPFFTTKRVGEGSGLGLPMVYGIVQQHQGRIEVQSQVNVGTRVSVRFPAIRNELVES